MHLRMFAVPVRIEQKTIGERAYCVRPRTGGQSLSAVKEQSGNTE